MVLVAAEGVLGLGQNHQAGVLIGLRPDGSPSSMLGPNEFEVLHTAADPRHDQHANHVQRTGSGSVSKSGSLTLRVASQLRHISIGRTHAGTHIKLLVQDTHVIIVNATTGELLRELTLDPNRTYHGTGRPPGPTTTKGRTHKCRSGPFGCRATTHHGTHRGIHLGHHRSVS